MVARLGAEAFESVGSLLRAGLYALVAGYAAP